MRKIVAILIIALVLFGMTFGCDQTTTNDDSGPVQIGDTTGSTTGTTDTADTTDGTTDSGADSGEIPMPPALPE